MATFTGQVSKGGHAGHGERDVHDEQGNKDAIVSMEHALKSTKCFLASSSDYGQ
jgi:hypothetical protein